AEGAEVSGLDARRTGQWLFAPEAWAAISRRAGQALGEYHRAHPLRAGMPREELKSRLGLAPAAFGAAVAELARDGTLVGPGGGEGWHGRRTESRSTPPPVALQAASWSCSPPSRLPPRRCRRPCGRPAPLAR